MFRTDFRFFRPFLDFWPGFRFFRLILDFSDRFYIFLTNFRFLEPILTFFNRFQIFRTDVRFVEPIWTDFRCLDLISTVYPQSAALSPGARILKGSGTSMTSSLRLGRPPQSYGSRAWAEACGPATTLCLKRVPLHLSNLLYDGTLPWKAPSTGIETTKPLWDSSSRTLKS